MAELHGIYKQLNRYSVVVKDRYTITKKGKEVFYKDVKLVAVSR